jgi:copper resistance protein B
VVTARPSRAAAGLVPGVGLCVALLAGRVAAAQPSEAVAGAEDAPPAAGPIAGPEQHVAPEPAPAPMPQMPHSVMAQTMQMDDSALTGRVLLDQLEWRHTDTGSAGVWEGGAWYGGDYDKLWLRTEGERVAGRTEEARVELLWDRIVTRWWDLQVGGREDFGNGPPRSWVAAGVQGLAPYWFQIEATLYLGDAGRTAARLRGEYQLLLTQRLIVQAEAEANLYGRPDPARELGSGLADLDAGLRVRYEVRRELAPYAGIAWRRLLGATADRARAAGVGAAEWQLLIGVRIWF